MIETGGGEHENGAANGTGLNGLTPPPASPRSERSRARRTRSARRNIDKRTQKPRLAAELAKLQTAAMQLARGLNDLEESTAQLAELSRVRLYRHPWRQGCPRSAIGAAQEIQSSAYRHANEAKGLIHTVAETLMRGLWPDDLAASWSLARLHQIATDIAGMFFPTVFGAENYGSGLISTSASENEHFLARSMFMLALLEEEVTGAACQAYLCKPGAYKR